jgi:hypothetical protein
LFDRCKNLQTLVIVSYKSNTKLEALSDYAVRNCGMLFQIKISLAISDLDRAFREEVNIFSLALFRTFEEHGHHINKLEFENCRLRNCHFLEMPTVLGRLTSLTLIHHSYAHAGARLERDIAQTLGNNCTKLCHLSLELYAPLYKDDLEVLLFGLKDSLISLKLSDFSRECRNELQMEHSPFIHCTLVEKLCLMTGADADDLIAIGRLRSLKELKIGILRARLWETNYVTDEDYKKAFEQRQLISLQKFKLSGKNNFRKKAVMALLTNCPNLVKWSCNDIPQIQGLEEAVADCGPQVIQLQKLDISKCSLTIMAVASLCNIRVLHICGYDQLSEQDYRRAFQQENLVNLEVIKLGQCSNLDSIGFKALLQGSSKLQAIKLLSETKITGYSGTAFAKYLSRFIYFF